jgi:hypothetical protein
MPAGCLVRLAIFKRWVRGENGHFSFHLSVYQSDGSALAG